MKYEVAYDEFLVEANPVGAAVDGDATWKIADTEPGKRPKKINGDGRFNGSQGLSYWIRIQQR